MTPAELLADYDRTRRFPKPEEIAVFVREGTLKEVGEALCHSCDRYPELRKRFNELRKAHQAALPK